MLRATAPTLDTLGSTRCAVGESPLWSAAEQALYWVDIEGRRLHRWQHGSGSQQSWSVPERLACIALHEEGGLLCALESSLCVWPKPGVGTPTPLAQVDHPAADMRFNDGRTDRTGRFWVGSMLMNMAQAAPLGELYSMAGSGPPTRHLQGLIVPNGLAFSPDGRTLYLSDSHTSARCIWAFALSADGVPTQRRLLADLHQHRGRPDGAAVDVDGCYWTCANDGGCLLRFTPQGRLDRTIELPLAKPSMCAFGGPRLDELYITSIRPGAAPARPDTPQDELAGATVVFRPGVQGLLETPFRPLKSVHRPS